MKRPKQKRDRRQYPKRQPLQKNSGTLIARRLIVRALRRAGMYHVLKGASATVGFAFPASVSGMWIHNAAMDLLRDLTPSRHAYHEMYDSGIGTSSDGKVRGGTPELVQSHLFFGFASDESQFSESFRAVADCIVTLDDLDAAAIKIVFRAIMNVDAPTETIEAALRLPDGLISAVIKRGRQLQDVTRTLGRQRTETKFLMALPSIDDLSGYGATAEWGKAPMADLAAYKDGRIEWANVDHGAPFRISTAGNGTFFGQIIGRREMLDANRLPAPRTVPTGSAVLCRSNVPRG